MSNAEVEHKERVIRENKHFYQLKLTNKHLRQVQQVQELENAQFILSRGSRKVSGFKYIPPKYYNCNKKP